MNAEQIQSVVTVAAFRPLDDSVLVIKRAADAKYNAGLYEIPGGKIESDDGNSISRVIKEFFEEIGIELLADRVVYNSSEIIPRPARSRLKVYRYAAPICGDQQVNINESEAKEHPEHAFITGEKYQSPAYVKEVRTFLDQIFLTYQTRGTLLPLLHQPVLIQPILLDYPGYCAHLVDRPLDEKNYLMPHEGVRDVLRRLLRPLFPRAPKVVLAKRLAAVPTTFLAQGQSLPAWVLQYGIELAPHLAKSLDRTRVQSYAADVMPRMTDPVTKQGLDLAQRELIMPSTLTKMHLPRRRAPLVIT